MKGFSIIVAVDEKMGIGRGNALAWRLSADMKHFKDITTAPCVSGQNVVIMGRKTWESLPAKYRPLAGRTNAVITSQKDYVLPEGVLGFSSFDQAVDAFERSGASGETFVIGGAQVYAQAIRHPKCQKLYITHVLGDHSCDAFFPAIPSFYQITEKTASFEENGLKFFFCIYQKH